MKILKNLLVIAFLIVNCQLSIVNCFAQNIGINEPNPDNSALLEMTSNERGLLIPRMTIVQRDAIASPAQSLLIYNITDMCLQIWEDAQWNDIWCSTPCVAPAITSHPVDVSINEGGDANYTVTATGTATLAYQWQESTDGGTIWSDISNGGTNPAYSGATTSSLTLTNVPLTYDTYDYQCVVTNACGTTTSNSSNLAVSLFLICGNPTTIVDVTNGTTGETWMDRNLGASQQAIAFDDYNAYGTLFQWGRLSDGHECITWTSSTTSDGAEQTNETSTNSSNDDPGHSDFILEPNSPYDWRSPQNDILWQGLSGTNNPCPSGYRLPTYTELDNERASWSSQNSNGAYGSALKLVVAGYRFYSDGSLVFTGSYGQYWSSTVNGISSDCLYFYGSGANMVGFSRADGFSVRCIKD